MLFLFSVQQNLRDKQILVDADPLGRSSRKRDRVENFGRIVTKSSLQSQSKIEVNKHWQMGHFNSTRETI